ncbi:restriction endonuclease subunit S [bacterium]|nr:restriction endonuclease subunit S [bacterium]
MSETELPDGWVRKTVRELCGNPQYGYTATANSKKVGPKFLRITDIQDGCVNWDTVPYCECTESDKYKLAEGDILFTRTGATTGKTFLFIGAVDTVFASYLIRISPSEEVLPSFMNLYFQSPYYWQDIISGIEDGNRPNMNGTKLAKLTIPFPQKLSEQRRFVARIEVLTRRVEEARKLAVEREAELDTLLQALYCRMIEGVAWKPLRKIASLVRRAVKTKPDRRYEEMGIRSFGKGTFQKPILTGKQIGNKRIYTIHEGDLVFNNVFAWEKAIAVAKAEDHGRVGSHRFITYVPYEGKATSEFLCHHFLGERGIEDIRAASPGSAGRNRALWLRKLENILVPVPEFDEQKRFSEIANRRQLIRRATDGIEEGLKAFHAALLAKAFRGDL